MSGWSSMSSPSLSVVSSSSSISSVVESGISSDEGLDEGDDADAPVLRELRLPSQMSRVEDVCVSDAPVFDVLHGFLPLSRPGRRDEVDRASVVFAYGQRDRRLSRSCQGARMRDLDDSILLRWRQQAHRGQQLTLAGHKGPHVVDKMDKWYHLVSQNPRGGHEALRTSEKPLQWIHADGLGDGEQRFAVTNGKRGVLIRTLIRQEPRADEARDDDCKVFLDWKVDEGRSDGLLCQPSVSYSTDSLLGFHVMPINAEECLVASKFKHSLAIFDPHGSNNGNPILYMKTTDKSALNVCLSSIDGKVVLLTSNGDVSIYDVETGRNICHLSRLYEDLTATFQWAQIAQFNASINVVPPFCEEKSLLRIAFRKQVYLFDARSNSRGCLLLDCSGSDRLSTNHINSQLNSNLFYLVDQSHIHLCDARTKRSDPLLSSSHFGDVVVDSDVMKLSENEELLSTCYVNSNSSVQSFGANVKEESDVKKGVKYMKQVTSIYKGYPCRILPSKQALCNLGAVDVSSELSVPWNGMSFINGSKYSKKEYTILASNEVGELFSCKLKIRDGDSGLHKTDTLSTNWLSEKMRNLELEYNHLSDWLKRVGSRSNRLLSVSGVHAIQKRRTKKVVDKRDSVICKEREWALCDNLEFFQNHVLPDREFSGLVGKKVLNILKNPEGRSNIPLVGEDERKSDEEMSAYEKSMHQFSQTSFESSQLSSQFLPLATSTQVTESTPIIRSPTKKRRKKTFMAGF